MISYTVDLWRGPHIPGASSRHDKANSLLHGRRGGSHSHKIINDLK